MRPLQNVQKNEMSTAARDLILFFPQEKMGSDPQTGLRNGILQRSQL